MVVFVAFHVLHGLLQTWQLFSVRELHIPKALTFTHFLIPKYIKQHSSCVSCCKGKVLPSRGATSKQNLSSMCIHCNAKQFSQCLSIT